RSGTEYSGVLVGTQVLRGRSRRRRDYRAPPAGSAAAQCGGTSRHRTRAVSGPPLCGAVSRVRNASGGARTRLGGARSALFVQADGLQRRVRGGAVTYTT